jgi:hypothetical protein
VRVCLILIRWPTPKAPPTRINEPAGSSVPQHFALEQISIDPGMMNHEWRTETGAERNFRSSVQGD